MSEEPAANDSAPLFFSLIAMLSTSAIQQLGKMVNPLTGKAEVNLEGAQLSIDMLSMLQEKTKGNLSTDEQNTLAGMLADLQMNYVQTAASVPAKPKEAAGTKPAPTAAAAAESGPEAQTAPEADSDKRTPGQEPKYHKSYG